VADRIAVDWDLLFQHAARVDRVGDDVSAAAGAASKADLTEQALGSMCSFLVSPATVAAEAGEATITSTTAMVERTGQQIRGWAGDAREIEREVCAIIASLKADVDTL